MAHNPTPNHQAEHFLTQLQEAWCTSDALPETLREIVGRFALLDVETHTDEKGYRAHYIATPRTRMFKPSVWNDDSIGLVVGKPDFPYIATPQVLEQPDSVKEIIAENLNPLGFEQWLTKRPAWNDKRRGMDLYNLGRGTIPYKVASNSERITLFPNRERIVYDRPVVMIDAASTPEFFSNASLVHSLSAVVNQMITKPVIETK